MARSEFKVRHQYVGTGNLDTYSFDFKLEEKEHLLVLIYNNLGELLHNVRGDDNTVLSDVVFDFKRGGGDVILQNDLDTGYVLVILLANDEPTQPYEFRDKASFSLQRFEFSLDFITGPLQRLFYLFNRTVRLDETTNVAFNPKLPALIGSANSVLVIRPDGLGWEWRNLDQINAGDFVETIDNTDYTDTIPEPTKSIIENYSLDTYKVIFSGGGIAEIRSIAASFPGRRLMLTNAQATTITIVNEDPGASVAANRISTGTGDDLEFTPGASVFLNYDGQSATWRFVGGTGGAGTLLGMPTDGEYGGPIGPIAGIEQGDRVEDAFDKVDTILGLLAPPPPAALADKVLQIPGQYAAREAVSGTLHPIVINTTTPEIRHSPNLTPNLANSFRHGDRGELFAEVNSTEVGRIALDENDNSGTDGQLQIVENFDPYDSIFGQQGFWSGIIARINSATLSVGNHLASLIHTQTGQADIDFWVDDAVTPSISNTGLAFSGTTSHRSGVPGIAAGQNITVTFDVNDAVKTHYNAVRIGRVESAQTSNVNAALPGSPPAVDAVVPISINVVANSNAYSENISFTARGYNSADGQGSTSITDNYRIDTVGTETRVVSGTGQYPSSGYGGAFDSTVSLATASNFELQYLNGLFRDPPAVNYSGRTPSGPDYSSLSYDSHNSMRWATFNLGSISSQTSVTFNINSSSNFGSSTIVSGIELYLRVDGATPTTGWLDANAAYPGVGNPTNNGDAALDVGGSSATSKRVTFGAAVKTGTVYVRIGIPQSSNKTFGSIS